MASSDVSEYLALSYSRVIIPDGQHRYAARILEFPGCFADGDTPDEAYRELEEVAESWIESAIAQGLPIPRPFEEARAHSGKIALRLPKSLHQLASHFARRDGVSLNQFLVYAVANLVGARQMLTEMADKLDDRVEGLRQPQGFPLWAVMIQDSASNGILGSRLGGDLLPGESQEKAATVADTPALLVLPSGREAS